MIERNPYKDTPWASEKEVLLPDGAGSETEKRLLTKTCIDNQRKRVQNLRTGPVPKAIPTGIVGYWAGRKAVLGRIAGGKEKGRGRGGREKEGGEGRRTIP